MKSKMAVVSFVLPIVTIILMLVGYYITIHSPNLESILLVLIVLLPLLSIILAIFSLFIIKKNNLEGKGYAISAIIIDVLIYVFTSFWVAFAISHMYDGMIG